MPQASCALCRTTWPSYKQRFFTVPKADGKKQKWANACGRELSRGAKVCQLHFDAKDIEGDPEGQRKRLSESAVPMQVDYLSSWNEPAIIYNGKRDFGTQTGADIEKSFKLDNLALMNRIKELEAEVSLLKIQMKSLNDLRDNMTNIFTPNQIRKVEYPNRNLHWEDDDIRWAWTLHTAGPKAYTYLYKKGFPLPSESTLAKWLKRLKFDDDVLHFVLDSYEVGNNNEESDEPCVLDLTKAKIATALEHDHAYCERGKICSKNHRYRFKVS